MFSFLYSSLKPFCFLRIQILICLYALSSESLIDFSFRYFGKSCFVLYSMIPIPLSFDFSFFCQCFDLSLPVGLSDLYTLVTLRSFHFVEFQCVLSYWLVELVVAVTLVDLSSFTIQVLYFPSDSFGEAYFISDLFCSCIDKFVQSGDVVSWDGFE